MTSYLSKGIYKIPELVSQIINNLRVMRHVQKANIQSKKASSKVDHNSTIKQETRERER